MKTSMNQKIDCSVEINLVRCGLVIGIVKSLKQAAEIVLLSQGLPA